MGKLPLEKRVAQAVVMHLPFLVQLTAKENNPFVCVCVCATSVWK